MAHAISVMAEFIGPNLRREAKGPLQTGLQSLPLPPSMTESEERLYQAIRRTKHGQTTTASCADPVDSNTGNGRSDLSAAAPVRGIGGRRAGGQRDPECAGWNDDHRRPLCLREQRHGGGHG